MEQNNENNNQVQQQTPDEIAKTEAFRQVYTEAIRLHIDIDSAWRMHTHGICNRENYFRLCNEAVKKFIEATVDVYDPETV